VTRPLDPDKSRLIQDNACALILESGFDAFTMQALARACGIAAGTIYRYYSGKEDLVNSIYKAIKTEMTAEIEQSWTQAQSQPQPLRAVFAAYLRYCAQHPERMLFVEQFFHSKYLRPEQAEAADREFDALLQLMGIPELSPAERALLKSHLLGSLHQTALLLNRIDPKEAAVLEQRALDMTVSALNQFFQSPRP
jgi:AcrR family transcriptional regulator